MKPGKMRYGMNINKPLMKNIKTVANEISKENGRIYASDLLVALAENGVEEYYKDKKAFINKYFN